MSVTPPPILKNLLDRLEVDPALTPHITGGDVAAGVASIVRIYGGHIPTRPILSTAYVDAIAPAIVIASAGGPMDIYIDAMGQPRIEIRAYGPSDVANEALWMQALAACRRVNGIVDSLWLQCNLNAVYPTPRQEPQTGFLYYAGMVVFTAIAH